LIFQIRIGGQINFEMSVLYLQEVQTLRDALALGKLIEQIDGRWSVQFRSAGMRYQGWCMDSETFKERTEIQI